MRFQIGLAAILVISVTSSLYGLQEEANVQENLVQYTRANDLIMTVEKVTQLEARYASATSPSEKDLMKKFLEEEKQNYFIQNKMMKIEKVRHDSAEEDELYDSLGSAWNEYAQANGSKSKEVQARVKDAVRQMSAFYYSEMMAQMSIARDHSRKREAMVFGSLILQAIAAGFLVLTTKKAKKKSAHFKVIPIGEPKKKTEDSNTKKAA